MIGFNFRDSAAFVTDGANTAAITRIPQTIYPTNKTINSVVYSVGYVDPPAPSQPVANLTQIESGTRDRNNTIDARLAGTFLILNDYYAQFRVDLPEAGAYKLTLACGDATYGTKQYIQVYDGTTLLATIANGVTVAGGSFMDANGAVHTAANYAANNTSRTFTFTTTQCIIRYGGGALGGTNADTSTLNHLSIEPALVLLLGNNNLGDFPITNRTVSNSTYWLNARYVGLANGTATVFKLGVFDWGNLDFSSAVMTVYDEGGAVLTSATMNGPEGGWVSQSPAETFPVHIGDIFDITVMVTWGTGYFYQSSATWQSKQGSASSYPNPLVPLAGSIGSTGSIALAIEGTAGFAQSIDDVNSGSDAVAYSQVSVWNINGFTPNAATLAGVNCSAVSLTGFTAPSLVDETTVPMPGVRELFATDGTVSAVIDVDVSFPAALRGVFLSGTLNTSSTGVSFGFIPAAKAGDVIAWPTEVDGLGDPLPEPEQTIIDAQANISPAFFTGTRVFWHISVDASDSNIGVARSYTVTLGENGSIIFLKRGRLSKTLNNYLAKNINQGVL